MLDILAASNEHSLSQQSEITTSLLYTLIRGLVKTI